MAFVSLDIPNFRALRNLKVEELRRINILVGKNNSGKTSLLEAVELLCCFPDEQKIAFKLIDQRYTETTAASPLSFLAYRSNGGTDLTSAYILGKFHENRFSSMPDFKRIDLVYKTKTSGYYPHTTGRQEIAEQEPFQREYADCNQYYFTLSDPDTKRNFTLFEYGPLMLQKPSYQHVTEDFLEPYQDKAEKIPGFKKKEFGYQSQEYRFVPVSYSYDEYAKHLSNLVLQRKLKIIERCLQSIDEKIKGIHLIADANLFVDVGSESMLPLNSQGEGTQRIVRLLAAILSLPRGGVCLIDEIDTGLHYTALPVMWKAVLQAAEDNDVQVFATTHSDECVEALVKVLKEKYENAGQPLEDDEAPLEKADCALYRLEQKEDGTKAYRYDMDTMEYNVSAGLEVR